ncbi:unnamed protein product [Darwinula stevensoni]|uniref:Acyltransferase 3 domain-containing protein n=1 Tax=Darwinula stevensoni TaxID=69355 RepID=A0A7R8XH64_9CRUS|nr:unnamed protein product [Darwinula stevensoni]CAG0892217.1 unnamed protein product [Darwinula stevensoni]
MRPPEGKAVRSDQLVNGLASLGIYGVPFLAEGICLPSSCSDADVQNSLSANFEGTIQAGIVGCQDDSVPPLTTSGIIFVVVLSLCGVYFLIGTIWDLRLRHTKKKPGSTLFPSVQTFTDRLLVAGSFYSNGEKLLSTKQGSDVIGSLHGIRFVTMTWVLLGHTYSILTAGAPIINPMVFDEMTKGFFFNAIMNATPSVDTFFFMSGLLVSYLLLKELQRNKGKFNIIKFYIHRYIRLTPIYAMVLWFSVDLFPYTFSGPFQKIVSDAFTDPCRDQWWRNLLYVNNMVEENEGMCMGHAWYMANDFQMYIISPLIILPLFFFPAVGKHKNEKYIRSEILPKGMGFAGLLLAGSITVPAVVLIANEIGGTYTYQDRIKPDDDGMYWKYYVKPWTRFGPYLIGLVLGYILHRIKGKIIKLSKVVVLTGWCAAIVTNMAVIYGLEYYMKPLSPAMPRAAQVIYVAVHRVAWSVGLAWVVFACHIGAGGPVNTLLSWKAFVPLGRLTYSAYLVHVLVAAWYQFGIDSSVYVDHETQVREGFRTIQVSGVIVFLSTLILTHFVAVIFSLTFEIPVLGLEKLFCGLIFGEGPKPGHNNFPVALRPHSIKEGEKGKDFSKGQLEVVDLNLASPETGILKGDIIVHDVSWEKPKYSGLDNPAFIPDTKQKLGHDELLDGQSQHKSLSSFSHSTPRDSSEETREANGESTSEGEHSDQGNKSSSPHSSPRGSSDETMEVNDQRTSQLSQDEDEIKPEPATERF